MEKKTIIEVFDGERFDTDKRAIEYCEERQNELCRKLFNRLNLEANFKYEKSIEILMSSEIASLMQQASAWHDEALEIKNYKE